MSNNKIGFTYNGTMGNEFSTGSNPFGIVNSAYSETLLELGNVCKCTSGRCYISKEQVEWYIRGCERRVSKLRGEIATLESMPYDLGVKITIDSKYTLLNAYINDVYRCLVSIYKDAFYNRRKDIFVEKVTFAHLCKYILSNLYICYGCPKERAEGKAKVTAHYNKIMSSLGSSATVYGNKNINQYNRC
jgi:hypothetical protein